MYHTAKAKVNSVKNIAFFPSEWGMTFSKVSITNVGEDSSEFFEHWLWQENAQFFHNHKNVYKFFIKCKSLTTLATPHYYNDYICLGRYRRKTVIFMVIIDVAKYSRKIIVYMCLCARWYQPKQAQKQNPSHHKHRQTSIKRLNLKK